MQSTADDEGEFGNISNVVKLQGMLDELDVTYEIEEKNLLQEIGEQFSKDYGPIERLFIWREQNGGKNEVFVKFTNQLSALNACGGTNEMTFAGNPVKARFFDAVKFENGEYV
jgi:splicing factor 45